VESEEAVRDALQRLMCGKTCLLITHDLASAAAADRVLILEHGRIVEQGKPLELIETGARYRHLWDTHLTRSRTLAIPVQ
jgi:ABC-type multidrug transport system fused ATPase/permease subunit